MRKFLRDVILRSAEMIREREQAAAADNGTGTASRCMFCTDRPTFQVSDLNDEKSALVCDEHVGPFITTWTNEHELTAVRL